MQEIQSYIDHVLEIQCNMQQIHPLYKRYYPLVIVKNNSCYLYDCIDGSGYSLIKVFKAMMRIPDDITACFRLDDYHGKYCCIIGYELISKAIFPIMCLHEMVHCYQGEYVEEDLKKNLMIADEQSPLWEIQYPFNYKNKKFIELFNEYLHALRHDDINHLKLKKKVLLDNLNVKDKEYLLWQEWKEGFARFMENEARKHLGFKENLYGDKPPFSRISFYRSGDLFINHLHGYDSKLIHDLKKLFFNLE